MLLCSPTQESIHRLHVLRVFLKTVDAIQPFRKASDILKSLERFEGSTQLGWNDWCKVKSFFSDLLEIKPVYDNVEIEAVLNNKRFDFIYTSFEECVDEAINWQIANSKVDPYRQSVLIPKVWVAKYLQEPFTFISTRNSRVIISRWEFGVKQPFESHFPPGFWGVYTRSNHYLVDFSVLSEVYSIPLKELKKIEQLSKKEKIEYCSQVLDLFKKKAKIRHGWIVIPESSEVVFRAILKERGIAAP